MNGNKNEIPESPDDPMQMEQGAIMDCIYCGDIYPNLGDECPACQNSEPAFHPARMMDRDSSLRELLPMLLEMHEHEKQVQQEEPSAERIEIYRKKLISMVGKINLYGFDIKEALIQRVHDLDVEFDIDPRKGTFHQ